jgi:Ser/Thr protein kinase RdoA (MazF antagonist)
LNVEYGPAVVADLERTVALSLPRWDLSPATSVSLLNLSENATFALSEPRSGRELVLRVHRIGYSSAVEIRSELAWLDALRRDGVVDTAAPCTGRDGEWVQTLASPSGQPSRHAVAFERLPGRAPDAGDALPWFERLGAVTARMHAHARRWRAPPGFARKRWDFPAMVGPQAVWGPWAAASGLDAAGAADVARALADIEDRLAELGSGPARFGLVHADLRLANLLADGERLRIIDFDDCGFSWFAHDFATSVSFFEHEPNVPALLTAWLAGYRREGSLSAAECDALPAFVVLRRVCLTAWLASHAEIPFAREFGVAYTMGTVEIARQYLAGEFMRGAAS